MQRQHNTHPSIEAHQIHIEEDLYPLVAIGAMDRESARFLATHPPAMRRWREDTRDLQHLPDDIG